MGINPFEGTDSRFRWAKPAKSRRGRQQRPGAQSRQNRVAALALSTLEQLEARDLLAADVIISEIMYHPSSALSPREQIKQEYIEIYNKGDAAANLNGWQFTAGVNFTFPNTSLPAGQYLVIAADATAFHAKYAAVANYIGGWYDPALEVQGTDGDLKQIKLSDGGEKITLKNAAGTTINSVEYASQGNDWAGRQPGAADTQGSGGTRYGWDWFSPADGGGKSMELMNPALSNAFGQNWSASTAVAGGTPGSVNAVNSANIAPIITEFQQSPALPKTTDPVNITVRITDELTSGLTATLNYRTNTGAFIPVNMVDDGAHGDGYAGDGVYGGTIPAQAGNLTVVEFYVRITDAAANAREYPKPGLATQLASNSHPAGYALPRAVYQVNNAYPNPLAWTPTTMPQGYMVLVASEKTELDAIFTSSSALGPNARMAGTYITVDGTGVKVYYDVGIRNRGHGSRSGPPNNFDIGFAGSGWNGQSNLVLNKDTIPSQIVGTMIFSMADIASYQGQALTTFYNGTAQGGQAQRALEEAVDSNFVGNHFPLDSGGNLYTMQRDLAAQGSADFRWLNTSNAATYAPGYIKQTNTLQNDYSDLINLIKKINNVDANGIAQPVGVGYLASISSVIDVDQWLRYLTVTMLLSNNESGLYTNASGGPFGDDYEAYRGLIDPRFKLVTHDLDSIMGLGAGAGKSTSEDIFAWYTSTSLPAFKKFLEAPEITPLYYKTIVDVINSTFNSTFLNPLIDRALIGVTGADATSMKNWVTNRSAGVLSQIKTALTATTALAVTNGYPRTTIATATITGGANAITTRSVLVNGQLATFTPKGATFTISGVTLSPGINRVLVQSMDGFSGTGNETARAFVDIWYDDATVTSVAGVLPAATTTTWLAADGPFRVTADLTIPADSTLVIQPGTSVFFDPGVKLIVNGTLTAVGTDLKHIRLTRTPGAAATNWGGVVFTDSINNNQLSFVEQEFGDVQGQSIIATNSQVTMDRVNWLNTTKQILNLTGTSFSLTNSTLPAVVAEMVHIVNLPTAGFGLIQGNTFGTTSGKFDVIGVVGDKRPNAIMQILDNTFNGAGDEILDFRGADAHVENNVFMNVGTTAVADTNNAISAAANAGVPSEITSVRNYFWNVAHVYLIKEGSFVVSTNNTAVNVPTGVVNFNETGAASPGLGATIDGDIYFTAPTLFQNLDVGGTPTQLTVSHSATPGASAYPGVGNTNADPRLTKTAAVTTPRVDFVLKPGSPAIGAGPNGVNMGAIVAAGATITGEPPAQTAQNTATLIVGGAGISSYKYRVNGGAWSAETPVATPISLAALVNGSYTVQVAGRNSAGVWQADAAATTSKTWTVNSALVRLLINEVLANNISVLNNGGTFPDAIELYNAGAASINLAGMSISDNSALPTKYVFPAGTTLGVGQYMVLYADPASAAPGVHLGFALSSFGEGVFLYNTVASGGALIDSVEFGQQAANLSIGRVGQDQHWALNTPTIGAANVEARLGSQATLKINEWLANEQIRTTEDFVELYNPDTLPVSLGGMYLTDDPESQKTKHQIAPLTFIAPTGYTYFLADNKPTAGPEHLSFALASTIQYLGLFDAAQTKVDRPLYFMQSTDYAQGLSPDGSLTTYAYYKLPTPGLANSNSTNVQGLAVIDNLRITEIMYNPLGSANTEYIELRNNSASTMSLTGVRITNGIDFTFPAMNLAAGAYVLVVADLAAFQSRYGATLNVAGQYTGSLSNGGEGLLLELPLPFEIGALRFDYSDVWYPTTDGGGFSLAINSATAAASTWGDRSSWHASGIVGGSPGLLDPATTAGLTGHAFRDLNNNGIQDAADPPISGLTAAVYGPGLDGQIGGGDDVLLRTGTSDSLGDYTFFGLAAGNYYIQFTPPPGYSYTTADQGVDDTVDSDVDAATGRTALFALAASGYDTSRDAGLVPAVAGATIAGRKVFYNNSLFDGNNAAANAADDAAIATGKAALLNGSTATFANYTSYSRGINGIMVDVAGLAGIPVASDFVFRVGNFNAPNTWALAPAPTSITVRAGAGTGGSSRVELIWADGAIKNQWLQVTVKATANTGLAADDVFYFGNAIGETGNSGSNAIVNSTDEIGARNNPRTFSNMADVTFVYDFNRDGYVNATDQLLTRANSTTAGTALQLISPPAGLAPLVVSRQMFYNNSSFDGNSLAADSSDDGAIAADKSALLPGGAATFTNYSSYSRGINGILVDVYGLASAPMAGDFVFRTGNNSSPSGWAAAPAPSSIVTRSGAGSGGSSRVQIAWADGAIANTWLQVTVKAGANTGLAHDDVFYFGNAIGETGGVPSNAIVNSTDEIATRGNARSFTNPAPASFVYDFNRDGLVNATDQIIARVNSTTAAAALQLISAPLELSEAVLPVSAVASVSQSQAVQAAPAAMLAFSAKSSSVVAQAKGVANANEDGSVDSSTCVRHVDLPSPAATVAALRDAIYAAHHGGDSALDGDLLELIATASSRRVGHKPR